MSRNIAAAVRVVAGRRSVETDFSQALVDRNHCLDHFFDAKEVMMKEKPKKNTEKSQPSSAAALDEFGYKDITIVGVCINHNLVPYI